MKPSRFLAPGLVLIAWLTPSVSAAPVFFGPLPYLSATDIPATLYGGGAPIGLEDFEDGSLDLGITVSESTSVFGPAPYADSVDLDDGRLDGSGTAGRSLSVNGATVTFFFPAGASAGGAVWTDGPNGFVTFEAFGPGMASLGTVGPVAVGDGSFLGGTVEDRFFGIRDPNGVTAIRFTHSGGSIEVDHVQFGVPLPSATVMALAPLGALGVARFVRMRR